MHPYEPLLPQQRTHGWIAVQIGGGVVEIPLFGNAGEDAKLERIATCGGRWAAIIHRPDQAAAVGEDHYDRLAQQ